MGAPNDVIVGSDSGRYPREGDRRVDELSGIGIESPNHPDRLFF